MHRFESQPAYILHSRPYRETSLLLEIFTLEYGRISAVAKGAKRPKARARGLLQPFVPLLIACVGRGELLTLSDFDSVGSFPLLTGRRLVSAFYLNELMVRLLHRGDTNQELYQGYEGAIQGLAAIHEEQHVLRLFEKTLLKTLGYELQLVKEVETGDAVHPDRTYLYDPEKGPILVDIARQNSDHQQSNQFYRGKSLLALAAESLNDMVVLGDAKRLMRQALALHLGNKPIESRRLL